jgi:hypothetical protein
MNTEVNITFTRSKFDNSFDDEIKERVLEHFKDCEITNISSCIVCDVCGKQSKERNDFIRSLCDKCNYYYDYCNHHELPKKCPLKLCTN